MQLQSDFDLLAIELIDTVEATDTTKFAFKTRDGNLIEAILMYHRQNEKYIQNGKQSWTVLRSVFLRRFDVQWSVFFA